MNRKLNTLSSPDESLGRAADVAADALGNGILTDETAGGASIAAWQFFGGRIATVALGNGIVTSFMNDAKTRSAIQLGQTTPAWGDISTDHLGYDGSGRLIGKRDSLAGSVLVGFTTAYDPSSNKLFERALHAESRSALYGMDSMDRLLSYSRGILATGGGSITTAITLPNTDIQRAYALDGLGNWRNTAYTPVGSSPGLDARTHNKLNQITQFDAPSAPTPILYDQGNNAGSPPQKGNGNIIDDGTRINAFDALNRLITVTRKIGTVLVATYAYDALGRRIIKDVMAAISGTVPTGTSRYVLDGQRIVEELDGAAGSAIVQYVWGQYIDELVQLNALVSIGPQPLSAGNYYLLSDLLYRSAALTGSTGTIVEAYDTDAYGNTLLFSAHGTDGLWFTDDDVQAAYSACRYVFTGREWDAETGVYFYRARYSSPSTGGFLSRDRLLYSAGMNLYQYLGSRPALFLDPLGLRMFVWPSSQTPVAGNVVAGALQAIVPTQCAKIYAEPTYEYLGLGRQVKYWKIKYIEKLQIKDCCCWDRLKAALDEYGAININLSQYDDVGKPLSIGGYGSTQPDPQAVPVLGSNDAHAYIDYSYLLTVGYTVPGANTATVADPFEIVLWHEALGHGLEYIQNRPYDHVHNKDDPIVAIENEARDCWNKTHTTKLGQRNLRYFND